MNFRILYIEDDAEQVVRVKRAVAESNTDRQTSRPVLIASIASPEKLRDALEEEYDLVLADVYFPNEKGELVDRLDFIIESVERWSASRGRTRALPVVAYTSRGKPALEACLGRRKRLYDIWDKSSASPPYVAWRFNQVALEFARSRPDTLLQRRISGMSTGASWHEQVVDMVHRYNDGWTERDQVEKCSVAIQNIAHQLKTFDTCNKYWECMLEWEMLGRSISRRTRGHARHVINVFWLGYFILHHDHLRDWFSQAWSRLIVNRADMGNVAAEEPLEALSTAWYYAALFHDVAGCVEKNGKVVTSTNKILAVFGELVGRVSTDERPGNLLQQKADELFHALGDPLRGVLTPLWKESIVENSPDHGVVAAVHLVDELRENALQLPYAREAARAMMVHNLVGALNSRPATVLAWDTEPLACLLVLCDQVQTWDRNRGDQTIKDRDDPERAELSTLTIERASKAPRATLKMDIDYIAPRHLDHAPQQLADARDALEYILKDKPSRALARIQRPWPFEVVVECWLNSQPLATKMSF